MASPYASGEAGRPETIDHGRPPRPPHPHRVARLVTLAVVVVLVAGTAFVLDHRARHRESASVAGCVEAATSSVRYTNARVDAIASYVRPARDAAATAAFRRRLEGIVSRSVRPTVPDARRALARCTATRVLWLHHGLQDTRRDCLVLLRRDLAYLDAVVADGSRAFDERSLPPGRCTGR